MVYTATELLDIRYLQRYILRLSNQVKPHVKPCVKCVKIDKLLANKPALPYGR
jgi:hypothetical protein